jgi:hypothetical protein
MEILIYISGLLTTFIAVLLVAAIKINRKYNLLLDSNQHISNISSIQNGEMREQIDDMRLLTPSFSVRHAIWIPTRVGIYTLYVVPPAVYIFKYVRYMIVLSM